MRTLAGMVVLAVAAIFVSPAAANRGALPSSSLTLTSAGQVGFSPGGAAAAPYGYKVLHPAAFARAKALADARAHLKGSKPGGGGGGGPTVSNYANVSPSFNAAYDTGVTPPDTTGAIGPDRYIEAINTEYAIYSRTGSALGSGTLSALTGISGGLFGYSLSDPQMMWDPATQRFYYSAVYYDAFLSDNGLAAGWSKTATPSSASDFCQYAIPMGSELPDYPKLGDSSGFLIYGYNKFGTFGSTYDGSEVAMLNKPPSGSTCALTSDFLVSTSGNLRNADGTLAATPVPANLVDDGSGPGYVVANADLTSAPSAASFLSLYTVDAAGSQNGIPVAGIRGPTNVTVPSYTMPSSAAERGSSYLLDTLDGRLEAAVAAVDPARGGGVAVWTAHAVYGGAGAEERWYEIDPVTGSLLQSGALSDPSLFIWNGAISPDRANTGTSAAFGDSMAISVSTSSASTYPAIQFASEHGADQTSSLTNLVQDNGPAVDFSCSSTTPCRWGDYSGAGPDPAASGGAGKVWLANQYNSSSGRSSSTNWRTWVFGVTPTG